MAVLEMRRIHLVAPKRERKKILEFVQRRGMVEIEDAGEADDTFKKTNTEATRTLLDKNADTARRALEVLERHSPEKKPSLGFLRGREAVDVKVSDQFYSKIDTVVRTAQQILAEEREIAEAKAEIARIDAQREALRPWLPLEVPLAFRGTKQTAAFVGSFEGEQTLEEINLKIAEADPALGAVYVELVSQSKDLTCVMVLAPKKYAEQAESAVRAAGLVRPATNTSRVPKAKDARLAEKRGLAESRIAAAEEDIKSFADRRDDLRFLEDHMTLRSEKYAAIEKLQQSRFAFVLSGYVPAKNADKLAEDLANKFTAAVEILPLDAAEDAPVKLENSWFTEPVESVLESYALPAKGELDPTSVMSIFYYIMFGLMFSDAGYGAIMVAVTGFCLLKFKNMEPNWSKNVRMFFWCGLSTVFWGIVFSSYFGDVVDSVAMTFFGRQAAIPPLWFAPLDDPMKLLVFCLAIGIIHLTAGYVMKGVTCAKNKDMPGILYDAVLPVLVMYPLILVLLTTDIFYGIGGFVLELPAIVLTVCYGIAAICALGIIFTAGRESKNWGKRILKGVYGLYNVLSGWLSDVLSYSRLLALGLATGVIASVMNQLAGMAGGGIPFVGFLVYLAIFLIGHALNFGINVLGAYVHSNRLEFVEFFGKFYDGGGRKFTPLAVHTKHYKIVEEETQNV